MKLKTFYDFEDCGKNLVDNVRKEAIKWIKHYQKLQDNETIDDDYVNMGRISIMKEFFNLTEKDLK